MVERTYVDVNVFVYWLTADPIHGPKALSWIKKVESSSYGSYITSSLTLYEVLVIIAGIVGANLRNIDLVEKIIDSINALHGLKIVSVGPRDTVSALEFQKKYKLDYEDALHLAVALRNNAYQILSNDRDFDKTPLKRIF